MWVEDSNLVAYGVPTDTRLPEQYWRRAVVLAHKAQSRFDLLSRQSQSLSGLLSKLLVPPGRIELPTECLKGTCCLPLSYDGIKLEPIP